jgi:hypothetical protein
MSLDELMGDDRDRAAQELFDLCERDPAIQDVMKRYGATRATLAELFTRLKAAGAAQIAGGHYVAASALAYPETLEFLLRYFRGVGALAEGYAWPADLRSPAPDRAVAMRVPYELIRYFEDGRSGPVIRSAS